MSYEEPMLVLGDDSEEPPIEDLAPKHSDLDDLISELSEEIHRASTVKLSVPGRPGWWAEFNTNFRLKDMERMAQRATPKKGDIDPLELAFVLIGNACVAIGKGENELFGSVETDTPEGRRKVGPFQSRAIEQALAGKMRAVPGEKPWKTAIRWIFGAYEDERVLIQISNEVNRANAGEVVVYGADPTE